MRSSRAQPPFAGGEDQLVGNAGRIGGPPTASETIRGPQRVHSRSAVIIPEADPSCQSPPAGQRGGGNFPISPAGPARVPVGRWRPARTRTGGEPTIATQGKPAGRDKCWEVNEAIFGVHRTDTVRRWSVPPKTKSRTSPGPGFSVKVCINRPSSLRPAGRPTHVPPSAAGSGLSLCLPLFSRPARHRGRARPECDFDRGGRPGVGRPGMLRK